MRLKFLVVTVPLAAAACSEPGNSASAAETAGAPGQPSTTGGAPTATGGSSATGGTTASGGSGANASGGSANATGGAANGTGGSAPAIGPISCRKDGDDKTTLVFVNQCSRKVEYRGSDISGGALEPGAHACVDVGDATATLSSKRYWGFVGQDPGAERHTLAEFTFNTDFHDFDWYNISHVDAHNLPISIEPVARPACKLLSCPQDYLTPCPEAARVKDADGNTVSCVSPNRDDPNTPVVKLFESCDDAYAWSADDQQGSDTSPMRACAGEDWDIVFCPEGA
jgi:hypothetical protein